MERIYTIHELPVLVHEVLEQLKDKKCNLVLLEGDLGAGKTTFTQTLASLLGVTEKPISPTFVLMKRYETADTFFNSLVHIDGYRIEDGTLFKLLNLETLISERHTCICVEWPERIPELAFLPHCKVQLSHHSDTSRTIHISFNF